MIFYNGSPEFGGHASMGYDASKPKKAGRHRMEIGESSYASKSFSKFINVFQNTQRLD
jgi:hypothetical protein